MRKLRDCVVVITGASSGIGRATALAFARRGATLVLAAQRELPLGELARACEQLAGLALAVPTDVTDEAAVQDLARRAIETFGRIDVWVNNAGVTLFGRVEEAPAAASRRAIETNLLGCIHGARAALPYFREQAAGMLINVASVVGKIGPYTSADVASKFGIAGLSECLRQEVSDVEDIHVCTIFAPSTDTPLLHQAANYTGRAVNPLNPLHDPDEVAEMIVRCAQHSPSEVAGTRGGWQETQGVAWSRVAGVGLVALGLGLVGWWLRPRRRVGRVPRVPPSAVRGGTRGTRPTLRFNARIAR